MALLLIVIAPACFILAKRLKQLDSPLLEIQGNHGPLFLPASAQDKLMLYITTVYTTTVVPHMVLTLVPVIPGGPRTPRPPGSPCRQTNN